MRIAPFIATFIVGTVFASFVAFAWTGPTAAPPNGNVPAPVNVGTVDQIKSAGLGLNSLAVFGNAIISTVSGYLNFGSVVGSSGYGFRDNHGVMEYKDEGGTWRSFASLANGSGSGSGTSGRGRKHGAGTDRV